MPGSQLRKWLSIGLATAAFGAAAAALVWWLFADSGDLRQAGWAQTDSRVPARSVEPVEVFTASEFTAWRLGGGLDEVVVYDIVSEVRGAGVWLGTGLGLVRLEPSGRASIYRNFSNSPREWARELVFVGDAIALNLTLAPGNTNGEPVGTYLFHRADERFERVGEHTRALAFDGQHLLGVQGRSVVRFLPVRDAWMVEAVVPEVEICGEVEMTRAGDALWLSQQGVRRVGHGSEDIPCGVTRLVPGADATRWMKEDGLGSGFGRAIVGDESSVYISHGIQGDGLSVYKAATGRWQPLNRSLNHVYLGANVLGLSPTALWLGTPDGSQPLKRLDRASLEAHVIRDLPQDHFVSAIAGDAAGGAWAAWSRKQWEGSSYTVTTWVARIEDSARVVATRDAELR